MSCMMGSFCFCVQEDATGNLYLDPVAPRQGSTAISSSSPTQEKAEGSMYHAYMLTCEVAMVL